MSKQHRRPTLNPSYQLPPSNHPPPSNSFHQQPPRTLNPSYQQPPSNQHRLRTLNPSYQLPPSNHSHQQSPSNHPYQQSPSKHPYQQDRRPNLNPSPATFNLLNEAVRNNSNLIKEHGANKFMRIDHNTMKAVRTEVISYQGNKDVHIAYKAERFYNFGIGEEIPKGGIKPSSTIIRDMHLTEKKNDGSDGANDIHYGLGGGVTNEEIGNFSNSSGVQDQIRFENLGRLVTSARDLSWYDQNHRKLNEELDQQYRNLNRR